MCRHCENYPIQKGIARWTYLTISCGLLSLMATIKEDNGCDGLIIVDFEKYKAYEVKQALADPKKHSHEFLRQVRLNWNGDLVFSGELFERTSAFGKDVAKIIALNIKLKMLEETKYDVTICIEGLEVVGYQYFIELAECFMRPFIFQHMVRSYNYQLKYGGGTCRKDVTMLQENYKLFQEQFDWVVWKTTKTDLLD
jgi:hypothetical protein